MGIEIWIVFVLTAALILIVKIGVGPSQHLVMI